MKQQPWRVFKIVAVAFVTAATLVTGALIVPGVANAAQASTIVSRDLTNIRVGRHTTYDRIVLDFRGGPPSSFRATWVTALTADPSGKKVSLPGNKFLSVVVQDASGTDINGQRTYNGPTRLREFATRNVEAVAVTGDFERVLSIGVGARHQSWVHVFTLTNPSRLVIDIGH